VHCILTAIGTVLADDPLLTARGAKPRRCARRIVIDPKLRIPESGNLVQSIGQGPLTVFTGPLARAQQEKASRLKIAGVEVLEAQQDQHGIRMESLLRDLATRGVSTVLVEAGPGLLGRMFAENLIDESLVFIGPILLGDRGAPSAARIGDDIALGAAKRMRVQRVRRIGDDVMVRWGRIRE
jgi:diaminohydroxyphosphoribosylaminopyrimidine deaminase/5-amino-6-(5-phosphoribosylamino)uracil reductase